MKVDENGIGIADARSLSSEEGERGLANQIERSWISKFRLNKARQAPGRNYMATLNTVQADWETTRAERILADRSDAQIAEDPQGVSPTQGC